MNAIVMEVRAVNRCILDIESEGLDPKEGRIICIGVKDMNTGCVIVFHDESEERMLRDFIDYFSQRGFEEIVGYNIMFDLRYIFARLLKYDIYSKGFFRSAHTDLMTTMKSVKNVWSMNKPGTLQEWSEFLFGDGKVKITSVPDLYRSGMVEKIIEYNKKDLELTHNLWKKVEKVLRG